MLRNNKYYYEDCYMYFTFDGVHSSTYNLFIENEGDLTIENSLGESSEFVSAMFQEGSYYMGTTKSQKTFTRKCAAEGLSLSQYKQMMKWLSVGKVGYLVFDNNPFWGWAVVLDSVGNAAVNDTSNGLIVQFEIVFKTVGSYCATNAYSAYLNLIDNTEASDGSTSSCNGLYNTSMLCNEYGIPAIYVENRDNNKRCVYIQSINNNHQYMNFSYDTNALTMDGSQFVLEHNVLKYVDLSISWKRLVNDVSNKHTINYYGDSNTVLMDNNLVEFMDDYFNYSYQSNGVLEFKSDVPVQIDDFKIENNTIILKKEDIDFLLLNGYNYICFTKYIKKNEAVYDTSEWNSGIYPAIYTTYIFFLNDDSNYTLTKISAGEYANYLTNSGYAVTADLGAEISSGIEVNSYFLLGNAQTGGLSNDNINKIDNSYNCYMGKMNKVNITLSGDETTNHIIEVFSYNNL